MLQERGVVTGAMKKARNIPREEAIKKVERKSQQRPVHWRAMVSMDPKLQEVFPEPPLVA